MQFVTKDDFSVDWADKMLLCESQDATQGFVVPKAAKRFSGLMSGMMDHCSTDEEEVVQFGCNGAGHGEVEVVARWLSHFASQEGLTPTEYSPSNTNGSKNPIRVRYNRYRKVYVGTTVPAPTHIQPEVTLDGCPCELELSRDYLDCTSPERLLMNLSVMNVANFL